MPTNRAAGQVKATGAPLRQPGFLPQPSALTFGSPADLAIGWDGTVWAVDGQARPTSSTPSPAPGSPTARASTRSPWAPMPGRAGEARRTVRVPEMPDASIAVG